MEWFIRWSEEYIVNLSFKKEHEAQFFAMLLNRGEEVYLVNFSVLFLLMRSIMYSSLFSLDMLEACFRLVIVFHISY